MVDKLIDDKLLIDQIVAYKSNASILTK